MRKLFSLFTALALTGAAHAAVITKTAPTPPTEFCSVTEKAAPEIICDGPMHGTTTMPPQRIRWTIHLKANGQLKCLMWQQYQFIGGSNIVQAFDFTGACPAFPSDPIP